MFNEEKFLEAMRKHIKENEKGLYVFNNARYADLRRAYELLQELLMESGSDAEIEIAPSPLGKEHWHLAFRADTLSIMTDDMPKWVEITKLADNFCCDPLRNGKQLEGGFVFLGVMTRKR